MHGPSHRLPGPANAAGFTYLGLLIAVVILGVALSAAGTVWRTQAQREREQELLFIGREFRAAIAAYSRATVNGASQFPQDINDLLEDKRWPQPRHYLRRLYADPMTGAQDWTILRADSPGIAGLTGIVGIASSSKAVPLKQAGFATGEEAFAGAACYCDWKFAYVPRIARRRHNPVPPAVD
jgi:type II secretory pathway pseudopilin PulG